MLYYKKLTHYASQLTMLDGTSEKNKLNEPIIPI